LPKLNQLQNNKLNLIIICILVKVNRCLSISKVVITRIAVAMLILLQTTIFAQQYNFKGYSVENGLPYIQIFTIFQDSHGYLWSGGYGGLSKFNGKTFQNFSPKNGLANHFVNCITEDKNHHIIVGTIDGLSVLNNNKFKNYHIKDGLPSKNVTAVCVDFSGKTWIGTTKGLCTFENGHLKLYDALKNQAINCLYPTTQSGLWVGTNDGLFNINNGTLTLYTIDNGLADNYINCISQKTSTKELFIGTKNGLTILNIATQNCTNYHIMNGLLDEDVTVITTTPEGLVWIGSKSGLVNFDGKTFSYFSIRQDNNTNHIRSLIIDYENNLWIGTHNGLYKFRDKGFTSYAKQEGLGGAFIYQILEDKEHNLWITTENNGIYKYANGYFKNYSTKEGLLSSNVPSALLDKSGQIWFGTNRGISKFTNDKFDNISYGANFKLEAPISCLFQDSKQRIWVGGQNGLCCMEKYNQVYLTTYYKLPTQIKDYNIWAINEDSQGNIWLGTYLAGIYKLENKQFVNQQALFKTEIESALEIEFDSTGVMYAATLNGVLMYDTKTQYTKFISEKDGLASELVYSWKMSKNKKYLWAGTNQGISKINVSKLKQDIIEITSYNKADGFEGVECNTHGIYEDHTGDVWFGTVNGLIKYSPTEFKPNDNLSRTTISKIQLAYEDTLLADSSKLAYDLNNITFYVDGISLTNPNKVLYTYKLEGFDKNYSPYTDVNFAKYDNLPAGKYTFKVKSCNSEGIWNIEPTTFSFEIKAAFYKTWWFTVALLALVIGIVYAIFKIRLHQIQLKQKAEFDTQVEVSKAELKALRAQMNPHFVFNSLNSIQHYILNSKGEEAVRYLNKFAKLIRIILNNSEKPTVTINEDIEALTLYLELEKMRFENKFNYSIHVSDAIDGDYDEIPPMLIQPYLENAILHGINPKEGQGHINVEISLINAFIKISIIDDGIGRDRSKAIQSLQPAARHKSLGMKITKDRVRILNTIHQSNLNVNIIDLYNNNKEPIGTQVDLYIPYIK
jgi:ligand-binding sensor domain-containing protein